MGSDHWPHRYRVTIHTHGGAAIPYLAVTWLSPEKAVALAVDAHLRRYDDKQTSSQVHDVDIADLGPVDRTDTGGAALEGNDVVDRMEW